MTKPSGNTFHRHVPCVWPSLPSVMVGVSTRLPPAPGERMPNCVQSPWPPSSAPFLGRVCATSQGRPDAGPCSESTQVRPVVSGEEGREVGVGGSQEAYTGQPASRLGDQNHSSSSESRTGRADQLLQETKQETQHFKLPLPPGIAVHETHSPASSGINLHPMSSTWTIETSQKSCNNQGLAF